MMNYHNKPENPMTRYHVDEREPLLHHVNIIGTSGKLIPCQDTQCTTSKSLLMNVTENLEIELEQKVIQFEDQKGIMEIISFVETNPYSKNFVQKYQNEIRAHLNEWPYSDAFTPTYEGLVLRFAKTSIGYVDNAITLFNLLKSGNADDIYLAYEIAVFSEAARGREGKRSKIGVDNQQEILITELIEILSCIWTPELGDMEDKLNALIQTVSSGHSSAAELLGNFIHYIETCNEDVTTQNIESTNIKSGGLVRKLLREFCCYSLWKFNKQLHQYQKVYEQLKTKSNLTEIKRREKNQIVEQVSERIEKTFGSSYRFRQVIEQIDHLNFLNDNIDVKYSFKSWPGLIHWTVFANVIEKTGETGSLSERGKFLINR